MFWIDLEETYFNANHFRVQGFRFFFYSNEHWPPHIHVETGEATAKFNLNPVELVDSKRFDATEVNMLRKLVIENQALFKAKWDEYFNNH